MLSPDFSVPAVPLHPPPGANLAEVHLGSHWSGADPPWRSQRLAVQTERPRSRYLLEEKISGPFSGGSQQLHHDPQRIQATKLYLQAERFALLHDQKRSRVHRSTRSWQCVQIQTQHVPLSEPVPPRCQHHHHAVGFLSQDGQRCGKPTCSCHVAGLNCQEWLNAN